MSEALLVSNIVLWLAVIALGLVVAALTRQIGLLHERIAPAGALATRSGPEIGEPIPSLEVLDIEGRSVRVGGPDAAGLRTLLFFLSSSCPVCKTLLPTLRRIAEEEAVRLVVASDGEPAEHTRFRAEHGLEKVDYVLSRELGLRFQVAKLPYAALLDAGGRLRAKGLVNTREHVESLFEAERLGVASIQDYLVATSDADRLTEADTALHVVEEGGGR